MLELITFGATYILRSITTLVANNQEIRKEELSMMRRVNNLEAVATKQIRSNYGFTLFGVTASILAISAFAVLVVLPKVAAVFCPEIPVWMMYEQMNKGFLFFTSDTLQFEFKSMIGIVITPLDTHLTAAIAGLYFGSFKTTARR